MKDTRTELDKQPEVENPILIEGLAGIGHIGRNVVSYLSEHLETEKIGEIHSKHFPPYTIVKDDKTVELIKNDIYEYKRDDKPDLILVEGNAQASTSQGHYEIANEILKLAEKTDSSRIMTIGGYGTGDVVEDPEVFGAVTEKELKESYEDTDVTFDHDIGQIVGVSGLLLGMSRRKDIEGIALLGETPGFLMSDPKSTEKVLGTVEQILKLDIDYSDLDTKVEESQEVLKKLKKLKKGQSPDQDKANQGGNDLGYIG